MRTVPLISATPTHTHTHTTGETRKDTLRLRRAAISVQRQTRIRSDMDTETKEHRSAYVFCKLEYVFCSCCRPKPAGRVPGKLYNPLTVPAPLPCLWAGLAGTHCGMLATLLLGKFLRNVCCSLAQWNDSDGEDTADDAFFSTRFLPGCALAWAAIMSGKLPQLPHA